MVIIFNYIIKTIYFYSQFIESIFYFILNKLRIEKKLFAFLL